MLHISKDIIADIMGIDSFRRVNETHMLDLYIGKDVAARPTLLLISENEPMQIYSSKLISIRVGCRGDGRWSLSFSLNDIQFEDVFYHFCDDIIRSSGNMKNRRDGEHFVCARYVKWQELLRRNANGLLSFPEVKGLIGELVFLKDYLFGVYGKESSLSSWIGPDKADQDFVCSDLWYEVKATVSGAESVKISSIEQLDTNDKGELVIIYLDKTSRTDPRRITLNELVVQVKELLSTPEQRSMLEEILLRQGYIPREEYDEYIFKCSGKARYSVDSTFPALRRNEVPEAITNAQYLLSIASIGGYLQED